MDKLRISGRLDDLFSFTIFFQYDTMKKKKICVRFTYTVYFQQKYN